MRDDLARPGTPTAALSRCPLAVVDLSLTPGEQGLGLVRQLRARFPQLKLVVVGVHDDAGVRQSILDAGASGFVPRRAVATGLLPAVDAVLAGRGFVLEELVPPARKLA
jgi:DNA-binding NarL/FixJ family response regulator